jgi:phage/plasmid-associated DNA primase
MSDKLTSKKLSPEYKDEIHKRVIQYFYEGKTKEEIKESFVNSEKNIELDFEVISTIHHLEKIQAGYQSIGQSDSELYEQALLTSAQALFADVLKIELDKENYKVISETIDKKNSLRFFIKQPDKIYYEEALKFNEVARELLEKAVIKIFEEKKPYVSGQRLSSLSEKYERSLKSIRTNGFLNAVIDIYGRKTDVINSYIEWNATPECLPCLDGVIDFSEKVIKRREPIEGEYFRNPFLFTVDDIRLSSENCKLFEETLSQMFPDPETRLTALFCFSQMIANKGFKTFQIWYSKFGNNGKNTLTDFFIWLLSKRAVMLKPAVIMRNGDKSERRFGTIGLQNSTAGIIDESAEMEELAINYIKNLTSLSEVQAENKGEKMVSFKQTWVLILLTNELPRFFPANDTAFLNRLLTLPFSAVYYPDETKRQEYLKMGVKPENLHQEKDKAKLLEDLKSEGAGIIKLLIKTYVELRDVYNNKVPESLECKAAKKDYVDDNDTMEQFYNDNFLESENGFVSSEDYKAIYLDYFGHYPKGGYLKKFIERYKLRKGLKSVSDDVTGFYKTMRVIYGLRKKTHEDVEKVSFK